MARAVFRLEPLLKMRRLEEDRAKRVVAERLRQIRAARLRIESLDQRISEAIRQMRSLVLAGRIVPQEVSRQRGYIGHLQMQRHAEAAGLVDLEQKLATERAALAEAGKRHKILDKLKQHQQERLSRLESLAEQRAGDELGVLGYVRRQVEQQSREHEESGDVRLRPAPAGQVPGR